MRANYLRESGSNSTLLDARDLERGGDFLDEWLCPPPVKERCTVCLGRKESDRHRRIKIDESSFKFADTRATKILETAHLCYSVSFLI